MSWQQKAEVPIAHNFMQSCVYVVYTSIVLSAALLCLDHRREGHYKMSAAVRPSDCLSVRLSVACLDLTRERKGHPKIGNMEVHHTSNP